MASGCMIEEFSWSSYPISCSSYISTIVLEKGILTLKFLQELYNVYPETICDVTPSTLQLSCSNIDTCVTNICDLRGKKLSWEEWYKLWQLLILNNYHVIFIIDGSMHTECSFLFTCSQLIVFDSTEIINQYLQTCTQVQIPDIDWLHHIVIMDKSGMSMELFVKKFI